MSDLTKAMAEKTLGELGEVIQGTSFELGLAKGMDDAAAILNNRAGTEYGKKNDALAQFYRNASDFIAAKSNERAEILKRSKERENAAFRELDQRQESKGVAP